MRKKVGNRWVNRKCLYSDGYHLTPPPWRGRASRGVTRGRGGMRPRAGSGRVEQAFRPTAGRILRPPGGGEAAPPGLERGARMP